MTNKTSSLERLDRLTDSLVNDIIELSDEEILEDAKELFDNPIAEAERLRSIVDNALSQAVN